MPSPICSNFSKQSTLRDPHEGGSSRFNCPGAATAIHHLYCNSSKDLEEKKPWQNKYTKINGQFDQLRNKDAPRSSTTPDEGSLTQLNLKNQRTREKTGHRVFLAWRNPFRKEKRIDGEGFTFDQRARRRERRTARDRTRRSQGERVGVA